MLHSLKSSCCFAIVRFFFSLWLTITVLFLLLYVLPGDPVSAALGVSADVSSRAHLRHTLGLDLTFWHRYYFFLNKLFHLDLGPSLYSGHPVLPTALERFRLTLFYVIPASLLSIVIGYLIALSSHRLRSPLFDKATTYFALLGTGIPVYLLALGSFWLIRYQFFPPQWFQNIFLIIVLSVYPTAFLTQLFKNFFSTEKRRSYVIQLYAFNLSKKRIYWQVLFKEATANMLGSFPLLLNITIGNCFFIEYIFSLPGGCSWTINAILNFDYPAIFAATFMLALVYLTLNLIIHLIQSGAYGISS